MIDKIKYQILFWFSFVIVFIFDQWFKYLILNGLRYQSEYLDLTFALNTGVAFSMFSFLEHYLKYIHLIVIIILFIYLFNQKIFLKKHLIAFGMILGAGSSNLFDRFVHGGVVDMFFWHKWFEFAIFNIADVMINLGVFLILIQEIFIKKEGRK
ncbi:lipoprotein signal peptidase [Campylobacter novaezeelandiae]|uniref:signal peptidase II n=1 Tax=Campylobacter novaezeelandiae TaxID=2267891 RepID=UPI001037A226|nr:prolipoprotein signal peptidase II [Campylobacter novaezeelandiae]TBR78334.1 lipoprotein signal peptidase [Campylobacter novaezeelandiae]TBR79865.1 lipoprotein signal peptidase [Campylobacter novaezeelandiae]TBR80353.1 lipoprotein signal peptidase [Campylobacter novaezeelandiae]TBR80621.1 lipoprotein signal peptidase [Campylobacter novaezeelandiae]